MWFDWAVEFCHIDLVLQLKSHHLTTNLSVINQQIIDVWSLPSILCHIPFPLVFLLSTFACNLYDLFNVSFNVPILTIPAFLIAMYLVLQIITLSKNNPQLLIVLGFNLKRYMEAVPIDLFIFCVLISISCAVWCLRKLLEKRKSWTCSTRRMLPSVSKMCIRVLLRSSITWNSEDSSAVTLFTGQEPKTWQYNWVPIQSFAGTRVSCGSFLSVLSASIFNKLH